ncbi:MAG: hypothetical protein HY821_21645 [Acidobacteria bacterium]|nr:hypothetical protein [Acidobacteriota bacterium]
MRVFVLGLAMAAAGFAADVQFVAEAATAMVDGELVKQIQTAKSAASMLKKDPRDPWAASDNYDVNHGPFVAVKKSLIRLSRLCPGPCDLNLWMPLAGAPGKVQVVIRNRHEISQFWVWGALTQDMFPEMARVLASGERVTVRKRAGMVSVLTPVRDSLDEIVALVEVVLQEKVDPQENVQ